MKLKETVIGIELGSTRIKAVMLDSNLNTVASGSFSWENNLENGIWTYSYEEVEKGLQCCFASLKKDFFSTYGLVLNTTGAIGISAMMHGYIPLDSSYKPLAPFRTWRNTMTEKAASILSDLFDFNIPQRWSIAHLYQSMLGREPHLESLAHLCTLSVYVHQKLTSVMAIGLGEASGMFPIDSNSLGYDEVMLQKFEKLNSYSWTAQEVLPKIFRAGSNAGFLTSEGALFLDPEGDLQSGIPFAPPEGDAGTGMVATNSVRVNTGNVSAGTSDFAMVVLPSLIRRYREIDMVTTPSGLPVAMVHCNNCTTDINAWVNLFGEFAALSGSKISKDELFTMLYTQALQGSADCGGLLSINYFSGEGVTDFNTGFPIFVRKPDSVLNLGNFMRMHMTSALATLKMGLDILRKEKVEINNLLAHGGYFKTPKVGQLMLSAASGFPVSVMETASEGGPYGMALLCAYLLSTNEEESLEDFLDRRVFSKAKVSTLMASKEDIEGFNSFLVSYQKALLVERKATEVL